jgi:hypothetical protein
VLGRLRLEDVEKVMQVCRGSCYYNSVPSFHTSILLYIEFGTYSRARKIATLAKKKRPSDRAFAAAGSPRT